MSSAQLRYANQLEIIRSEEKDRYMISQLSQQLDELYTKLFGLNNFHTYQPYLHRLSEFLYYLTTTLSNRQTIGEEYVCLVQYDSNKKQIPSLFRRFSMIFFRIFGDLISKYLLSSYLVRPIVEDYFHPKLSTQTIELISRFLLTFIERTHKIFFYLTGSYYNLSKTITRIRYLIYTRTTSDSMSIESKINHTMKLLSLCLCIQHIIESYTLLKQIALSITQHRHQLNVIAEVEKDKEKKIISDDSTSSTDYVRCPLCYELAISNVALIPECGHVFCWECIHTWVIENQTCPLCKTNTMQSRIVHLINY
jgi:peroxin-10